MNETENIDMHTDLMDINNLRSCILYLVCIHVNILYILCIVQYALQLQLLQGTCTTQQYYFLFVTTCTVCIYIYDWIHE